MEAEAEPDVEPEVEVEPELLVDAAAVTVTVKALSDVLAEPSVTVSTMLALVPTSLLEGVPCRRPVLVLKFIHEGLPVTENFSVWPSGSEAVGLKEYSLPTAIVASGVPDIVGALFWAKVVPGKYARQPHTVAASATRRNPLIIRKPHTQDAKSNQDWRG